MNTIIVSAVVIGSIFVGFNGLQVEEPQSTPSNLQPTATWEVAPLQAEPVILQGTGALTGTIR